MNFDNELVLDTKKLSKREEYIGQHTGTSVEGGALNANYKEVDAVAHLSNKLGQLGYIYGQDWYWQDSGCDECTILYNDKKIPLVLKLYI